MSFIRTTRECSISQLHPGLPEAIREYFQAHQLGEADTATLLCCETISTREEASGLLARLLAFDDDPDTTTHLALLMTADALVWARRGDKTGLKVTGSSLTLMKAEAYTTLRAKNYQLRLSGIIIDSKQLAQGNLTLGPEPAAQKFCDELGQAVARLNPPVKSKWPKWMGGR